MLKHTMKTLHISFKTFCLNSVKGYIAVRVITREIWAVNFPEHVTTYSSLCCLQNFRNHITGDSSNVCTPRFSFKPRNDGDKSPWGFIHVSKYYRSGKWHLLLVFRASNSLRQMLVMRFEHVWIGSEVYVYTYIRIVLRTTAVSERQWSGWVLL